jgi:glycosyltransferase involved in cell wall biosynthesis
MDEGIKILRISTVPHSLQLLLKGQLRFMKSKGLNVSVACSDGPEIQELEQNEEVKHYSIPLSRKLNPIQDLIALYHLIKLIHKLKPDIVHSHSPKAGIVGMLAARICNVRLKIHTVAGLPLMETRGLKRRLLIGVEQITYKCADWVLPNSINQMEFIKSKISSSNKIKIIGKGSSNGIDLEYFKRGANYKVEKNALRSKYSISENDVVLLFVGRLTGYKGVNELIKCFKVLSEKYSNLKLLLVGPLEDINPLKPETVREIETNHSIISTGHQNDIRPFLTIADIFVFPSYREGFPQSLMQASAYELPCIASDINGCNEIIFNDYNGYLIPAKNLTALIDICEFLITNPDKRLELGGKGREYLVKNFEQKFFWSMVYDFYITNLK